MSYHVVRAKVQAGNYSTNQVQTVIREKILRSLSFPTVVAIGFTVLIIIGSAKDLAEWMRVKSWPRIPGQVLKWEVKVETHDEGASKTVIIHYSYSVGRNRLKGVWEGGFLPRTVDVRQRSCWVLVNPSDPTDSTLYVGFPVWVYFWLSMLFPIWTLCLTLHQNIRVNCDLKDLWDRLDLERYDGSTPLPTVPLSPIVDTGHALEIDIDFPCLAKLTFVYVVTTIAAGYLFLKRQVAIEEPLMGLVYLISILAAGSVIGYVLCQSENRIVIDSSVGELRWIRRMLHIRWTRVIPLSQVQVVSHTTGDDLVIIIKKMGTVRGWTIGVVDEESSNLPHGLRYRDAVRRRLEFLVKGRAVNHD